MTPEELHAPRRFISPTWGLVEVCVMRYHNDALAVKLVNREDGSPIATLSVNVEGSKRLPAGYFWAKTWAENAGVAREALASGIFKDTGGRMRLSFVDAQLWGFTPTAEVK